MLFPAPRDSRSPAFRQIASALLLAVFLSACATRREAEEIPALTPARAAAAALGQRPERPIGRVSMVDPAGRFVLVDAPYGVAPGTELQLRRGAAPVGIVRAGTERRAGMFAAGIEQGAPEAGDVVVLVGR